MDGYRLDLSSQPDWRPLEQLQRLCAQRSEFPVVDLAGFIYCGQLVGAAGPPVALYKHGRTRRYLCLDACGHAYVVSGARNMLEANVVPLSQALGRLGTARWR